VKGIRLYATLAGHLLLVAACGGSGTTTDTPAATPPGEARVSVVSTPVSVPLDDLRRLADRRLSGEIYAEDRQIATGTTMHIVVTRRDGPLTMTMEGDTLSTSIPLNIRGSVSVGIGPFRVNRPEGFNADTIVHLRTRIQLDENWRVNTDSETSFDIERAEVTVPGVSLNAPELAEEILNRNSDRIAGPLDAYLAGLDVRGMVEPVWQGFRDPIQVSENPSVWLRVEPVSFALSPTSAANDQLQFNILMRMYASSVVGAQPAGLEARAIPPLEQAPQDTGRFEVEIPITVELDEANRFIGDALEGREDTIGDQATIRWLGVELSGEGDRLMASVDFEAETGYWFPSELSGQMKVEGRPDYDPGKRTLEISNMDYELDSDSFLASIADWFLHDRIRERVQTELVFPLDTIVEDIQSRLQQELENVPLGGNGTLEARLESLEPLSVRVVGGAVELRLAAAGELEVSLQIPDRL